MNKEQNRLASTVYVIMGITGDLSYKKVIPSLWHLLQNNQLPERYRVVGMGRRQYDRAEFEQHVISAIKDHVNVSVDSDTLSRFVSNFSYLSGDFDQADFFTELGDKIVEEERGMGGSQNRIFYLATLPSHYESIFHNLARVGLNHPIDTDQRVSILIEKPFGLNQDKARALEALLSKYFTEDQIYRIDHYFFKEIVLGIENFRFSNNLFENNWNNTNIDKIELRLFEKLDVDKRGDFYDPVGALRDVGQNHLLALLSLIISEPSLADGHDTPQNNRAEALKLLLDLSDDLIRKDTRRAQYNGYQNIAGVEKDSQTETYFSIKTKLTGPKWGGVEILFEAGKKMTEIRKEIVVTLKRPKVCYLCQEGEDYKPNRIVFRFDDNDEVRIHFYARKPGFDNSLEEREFTFFLYKKQTKVQYVEEYAKVLYKVVRGDKKNFVSAAEVEQCWRFVDPIIDAWRRGLVPLEQY